MWGCSLRKEDGDRLAPPLVLPSAPAERRLPFLTALHFLPRSFFSLFLYLSFHSSLSPSLLPEFLSFSSRLGHLTPLPFLFPVT